MEIPFDLIGMIILLKDLTKLSLWSTVNFSVSYVLEMTIIYIFLLWVAGIALPVYLLLNMLNICVSILVILLSMLGVWFEEKCTKICSEINNSLFYYAMFLFHTLLVFSVSKSFQPFLSAILK